MLAMDDHMLTMSIEERRISANTTKVLENVPLDENNPKKLIRIGVSMENKTKQNLVQFLKKSIGVFAWNHEYMLGIDPSVITRRLNVYPSSKLIRQKKRMFALE